MLVVLLALLMSGFAVTDLLRQIGHADKLVDRYIFDDAIRPFQFSTTGGTFQYSVREEALIQYLNNVLQKVSNEVTSLLDEKGSSDQYFIEVQAAELRIDPSTGHSKDISLNRNFEKSTGSLPLSPKVQKSTDLTAQFHRIKNQTFTTGESLFAVPTALYTDPHSQNRFLPTVILIGLRVVWSIAPEFTGQIYQQLGNEPYIFDSKVSVLRGEVDA